ncbi:MAG: serine hydrolase [Bacteroidales bacterium]|nr:serine hydrolase [Bacteroidales bacterium]
MKKSLTFAILASIVLVSCLKDKSLKQEYQGYAPVPLNDGWEISTPENEQMDPNVLEQAYKWVYSEERYAMANSLLVIRNGKLIAEAYPKSPEDISRLHNLQSVTKSFTSLLTGIAIQQGLIGSINDPVYNYLPEDFDDDIRKREISLRNCLTMRAGLDFDNGEQTEELIRCEGNSIKYVLSLPMVYDTGELFQYNDGLPHLVGAVIAKQGGTTLKDFASKNLLSRIGIHDFRWEKAKDGLNFGAFSLYLTPRSLAKAGLLLAQNGIWEGEHIIEPSWIARATAVQSGSDTPYGYYFWLYPAIEGYMMYGHGGQILYVCPSKNLVVVYTAYPYSNEIVWDEPVQLAEIIYRAAL